MSSYKYYELLGLNKENNPSQKEIKIAYHKRALKHHPDKNPNNKESAELFKEITNAYSILSDEEKKRKYDQLGDNYEEGNNEINPEDIFSHFFGGRGGMGGFSQGGMRGDPFGDFGFSFNMRNRNMNMKCNDIKKTLVVNLEDVYNGIDKSIKINIKKYCLKCRKKCDNCDGHGVIKRIHNLGILQQISEGPCNKCKGRGEILIENENCKECKGEGTYNKEHVAQLKVKAGFENNYKTVFKGLGEQPKTSKQKEGDLIIELLVEDKLNFKREGNNLLYNCNISLIDSIIGKEIEILYFNNTKIKIDTKENGIILNNKEYIYKGKGLPMYNNTNNKGDLKIRYEISKCKIRNKEKINELRNLLNDMIE